MKKLFLLLALLLPHTTFAQTPPLGIWLTPAEIQTLPMEGKEWDAMKAVALGSWEAPKLSALADPNSEIKALAGAYYATRTGNTAMRDKVRDFVKRSPGTENGGRTLELARNLPATVICADLCGFATAAEETTFKNWLRSVRTKTLDGKTLISTQEIRPNNWGTQASFALACANRYLGDQAALQRTAIVFKGWLGDRSSYAGFDYGDLSWQSDPSKPVGINPRGAIKSGHSIDGVLPDDQRRGGGFEWPPPCENYAWTGLTPAACAAWVLARAGYEDVFDWQDAALLRAITWLHKEANCPATGNDVGTSWLFNSVYGTTFRVSVPTGMSREIGWLAWTHGKSWSEPPPPPDPEDVTIPYTFRFLSDTRLWTVNANGYAAGVGTTKNAALRDWAAKNPTSPP